MDGRKKLVMGAAAGGISLPLLQLAHSGGVGLAVAGAIGFGTYLFAEDLAALARGDDDPAPRAQTVDDDQISWGARLRYGKTRAKELALKEAGTGRRDHPEEAREDDFDMLKQRKSRFTFSELLATGWRPSFNEIFLARLPDGTNVFVTVEDLVHIALSGATRNGKTSIIRQLLSELIYVGCDCILLDPHFTPYDVERDEDWTPFIPKLKLDPMECKDYVRIGQIIEYADTVILAKRKRLRSQSKPVGKPIFLMIDEYPSIMANCPDIEPHIGNLLREGAKFQIYLCIASHDFLVKTAFPSMGSGLRDSLKTVFHAGGNLHTAKELLDIEKIDRAEEATLGKGRVYLRCETYKQAGLARTPWMNDEAIHELVGPSTYVPEVDTEELDEDLLDYDITTDIIGGPPPYAGKEPNAQRATRNAQAGDSQTSISEPQTDAQRATRNAQAELLERLAQQTGWPTDDIELAVKNFTRCRNRDQTLDVTRGSHSDDNRKALRIILAAFGLIKSEE